MALDREKKIMEQLQESLVTIDEIITGTKEQNLISISKSQVLLNDNMSNLTETVETVKDSLTARMDEIEKEIGENRGKLNDIQVSTYKHAQTVNDTLDKEIGRFEKIIGAFEKLLNNQVAELRDTINNNDEKVSKWKVSFEDLQTRKLLEIHSVLKLLNKNIAKGTKDSKERYDLSQEQIRSLQEAFLDQLTDIKKKIEVDDTTLEDRVQLTLTKLSERFDDDIIKSIRDYNELVRKTKNDFADILDKNNEEIKQFIEQKNKDFRDKIQDDRIKGDLLLEGRCQAFSIDIEKTMKERMEMLKTELERRQLQLKDDFKQNQKDIAKSNEKLEEYKKEVTKLMKDHDGTMKQWTRLELNREVDSLNITIFEKVEDAKMKLTTDINEKVEKEKRQRNDRVAELHSLMESNKNLINEHIRNQVESLKSLNKALVAKEASERTKEYENLMKILTKRIETLDKSLHNKIDEEAEKLNVRVDTYKNELDSIKETNDKHLAQHDEAIAENSKNIKDHYEEHKETIYRLERKLFDQLETTIKRLKEEIEIRALVNSMTEHLANQERAAQFAKLQKSVQKSLDDTNTKLKSTEKALVLKLNSLEIATTTDNLLSRASLDALDDKYEEALQEVASSIDNYIGIVNDTSNKQYEDFNKNLKTEFGKNLEQIQDILNNLRDEIDGQKEKVNGIELAVNKVEVKGKKDVEKVRERMEIERLVSELVGWVAEEKDLDKFTKFNNRTAKIKLMAGEADKKAESALEGLKEIENKREKDKGEEEKRREESKKKEAEDAKKREAEEAKKKEAEEAKKKEAEEAKKKKEAEESKKKEDEEKRKKEEEEKKAKDKKEEEEKKAKEKKDEEERKKKQKEEEEKGKKKEDDTMKKELEELEKRQNQKLAEIEEKMKKDREAADANLKKQIDENKADTKKQLEDSKAETKKQLEDNKVETKKMIDDSKKKLEDDFKQLTERNKKEIAELEERMVLELEDFDKKMNKQIELNEKWKNDTEAKLNKSK
jgi:hypothetical protein